MADYSNIAKLAVDAYRGSVEKYSVAQAQSAIHEALVQANHGKNYLDLRDVRDGKCGELFTLLEVVLSNTVIEGLQGDEFFNDLVEYRNVAEGDQEVFYVEDDTAFIVGEAADGTQSVRRQRLNGYTKLVIPTTMHMVRIYEELNRVLAGRVDFNAMVTKVAEAFERKILEDIYALWISATADQFGGTTYFPTAGTYDEDALLDLIAHVEAAAGGKTATIIGTKKALRNLKESLMSDTARDEFHDMGYVGKFWGTPVVAIPQRHKVGSTEFIMRDDVITIIAGDDKPIKFVYEGSPIVLMGNPTDNADLTQEYLYGVKYGTGIVLAGGNTGIGRYEIA